MTASPVTRYTLDPVADVVATARDTGFGSVTSWVPGAAFGTVKLDPHREPRGLTAPEIIGRRCDSIVWAHQGVSLTWEWQPAVAARLTETCRVYWGSHGCQLPRGHNGHCHCDCAEPEDLADPLFLDVGSWPYYGEGKTLFYGEDAAARGLPTSLTDLIREAWEREVINDPDLIELPPMWDDPTEPGP